MTKKDKLLRKLRNNQNDVPLQDVETLLVRFGFTLARVSGSHHLYEYESGEIWRQISIPVHGRKVKTIYVRKVIELIDELFPSLSDGEDESIEDTEPHDN